MDLSTVVLVDILVSGGLTFEMSAAVGLGCITGGIFKSVLPPVVGSLVSRVDWRSLRFR